MKFRDWIVLICKVVQWVLPCLLILAIIVMLMIKPNDTGSTQPADTTESVVKQTDDVPEHTAPVDGTESEGQTGSSDTSETTEERNSKDNQFMENVDFGAVKGEDDGALDDSVSGNLEPSQSEETDDTVTNSIPVQSIDSRLDPLHPDFDITLLTYEDYIAMDGVRQRAVVDAFSTPDVFIAWYNAVKARYEAEHPNIEVGEDGIIDGKDFG